MLVLITIRQAQTHTDRPRRIPKRTQEQACRCEQRETPYKMLSTRQSWRAQKEGFICWLQRTGSRGKGGEEKSYGKSCLAPLVDLASTVAQQSRFRKFTFCGYRIHHRSRVHKKFEVERKRMISQTSRAEKHLLKYFRKFCKFRKHDPVQNMRYKICDCR